MMRWLLLCYLLAAVAVTGVSQQLVLPDQLDKALSTPADTQHVHPSQVETIDGSQHPELIPDSTAYRLFFLAASGQSSTASGLKESSIKAAHIHKVGLAGDDAARLSKIIDTFMVQYKELVSSYNDEVARTNDSSGYAAFKLKREDLVQSTLRALQNELSPEGLSKLQAHVQSEKRNMKYQPGITSQSANAQ